MENHGLLRPPDRPIFAGTIPFAVRNPTGDWTNWLPPGERQSNSNVDTMACVSYALNHCIETQELFLTGKKIRYSSRWLAKLSGTTTLGNYLVTVADTVKNFGLVKEESWPTPANYTWATYYAEPTPAQRQILLAEGANWLKTHKLESAPVTTSLSDILTFIQQAPLWVTIPGHAIMNFYTQEEIVNYFDTYIPFQKQIQRSGLLDVFRAVLTMKNMKFINDNGTIWLVGPDGKAGFADMASLQKLQAIDKSQIENGSTVGIPQVGIFESGLPTFHD